MHKKKNDLLDIFLEEVKEEWFTILDFWAEHTIDDRNGGFVGEISSTGDIDAQADKGSVLNARILWSFSSAYIHSKKDKYLNLATRAFDYFLTHFWDDKFGGLFWAVNAEGKVTNDRKQAYNQGFGIYAFSEYYKASKDERSLNYAKELYKLLEEKFKDKQYGGYIEAFSRDWSPLSDMRLSSKDANEPKSMNTHLHIIEPYTNLFLVWNNAELKLRIQDLLSLFQQKILDRQRMQFQLFFDMDWTVKSNEISFGHDIESAWLLCDAARAINAPVLVKDIEQMALRVIDKVISNGTDRDGSLFYEEKNKILDKDKHWWVQAEAIIGLVDAYTISRKASYLNKAIEIWSFVKTKIKDREHGEWFWRVDKDGNTISSDFKVGFWKCPYHNSRALIETFNRLSTNQ